MDTVTVESVQSGQTRSKFANLPQRKPVDHIAAKALYLKGIPIPEIAQTLGCSAQGLYKLIQRKGWPSDKQHLVQAVQVTIENDLSKQSKDCRAKVAHGFEKLATFIHDAKPPTKQAEAQEFAQLLKTTCDAGSKLLGWDAQGAKSTVITFGASKGSRASEIVVDVQPECPNVQQLDK